MRQYDAIYYDISGVCNAKCPYCLSGRYKRPGGKFVTLDSFDKTLDRICQQGLLGEGGVIGLYNWGEPFLHPRLAELIHSANDHGVMYGFSTNAAQTPAIDSEFTRRLKYIIFSMPGFSQASYRRIHGFDFETILRNIQTIVRECRRQGFLGRFSIAYHVYQFNLDEIFRCAEFANQLRIGFDPCYAILNNWDHINSLLDNSLNYDLLRNVSEELFSFRVRELIAEAPQSYTCPQYGLLALDEFSNVLLCCQVPSAKSYSCGNLLTDDFSDILEHRYNNAICKECVGKGLAYYLNNSLTTPGFYTEAMELSRASTMTGRMASMKNVVKRLAPPTLTKLARRVLARG